MAACTSSTLALFTSRFRYSPRFHKSWIGSYSVRIAKLCRSKPAAFAAVNAEVKNDGSGSGNNPKKGVPNGSNSNRCENAAFNAVAFQAQSYRLLLNASLYGSTASRPHNQPAHKADKVQ